MHTTKTFVTTQLYSDKAWQTFLSKPSDVASFPETVADKLQQAIHEGIEEENKEVEEIAGSVQPPTFENTIVALSRTGEKLERATTVMYNLLSAETDDEIDALADKMSPILTSHANDIMLNAGLFRRVKAVYDNPPTDLTREDRMLLDKTYSGFERSGAALGSDKQKVFRELTSQLSLETLKFTRHLLKDTNAYCLHVEDEKDLAGIPDLHRKAAQEEARHRDLQGWVFTLHAPSYGPFMMYADSRSLREKMYRAYNTRCTHSDENNNFAVVGHIVNLRREIAQLLGYKDYAEYALCRRMAASPENVYTLINELLAHYLSKAKMEVNEVLSLARDEQGCNFQLQPWDFAYYSRKLKQARYDYDPDMLRPYFELSKVQEGVFGLATRLYGITFEPDTTLPVYHPDVRAYRVFDAEHRFLAVLFLDFFPRSGKQGGAWMTSYRDEHSEIPSTILVTPDNSYRPVVSVTTNFTKPTSDTPALLTLGEVETFLHEFGHALHGIFAMTHHAALSGTSVFWDFVELPSQFMENYAVEPDFLNTFARHYQTGELLPESYIEKIRRSRNFQVGYACIRQVSFALLDMAYYTLSAPFKEDVKTFEHKAWHDTTLLPILPEASMSVQFSHIMSGGYAAGYYSYKWAEVLDADAFSLFKQRGIFDKSAATSFRSHVLSQGGTELPGILYKQFRGKDPDIHALLYRDGLE